MASITGLGKIGLPRLSENMDPDTQLVQLGHQLLAAARVGIQRQPI